MNPAVAALRKEGFRIVSINVNSDPRALKTYDVRRLPTFIYVDEELHEVRRSSGNMSTMQLRQMFCKAWF